ncbi:hypothetical protein ASD37_30060 [Mycobacterium sp. Root135]|jgi:salicylate hydroxylase|uniref:FAD-dependent monooxygenase n=1 Tax=Mycobacterium sp. Root135 TaxID=1736457 RepID=UPI0007007A1E|nr:FAD-dependent monooxygenase [Mycobacterium sp. Root135]KQY01289.1 hypothetical protein ASD37_30060 [Mycobacterium sp. Root135]
MVRVVIVGAGIGGLTAAIALQRSGFDVRVVERAPAFGEVGAGVQLGPNATRVLIRLGMGEDLHRYGVVPSQLNFLRWEDGRVLGGAPVQSAVELFGAPYYTMYRPQLIDILAANLATGTVRFGASAESVREVEGRPVVKFSDGSSETGDIVIGADGVHSTIRSHTVGDASPRFSGMCAYRALVPRELLDFDDVVRNWTGPDRHVVAYPVGVGAAYLNVVAVVPEPQRASESWTTLGLAAELRSQFAGWCPGVVRILEAVTDPVYRWSLYDRDPLPQWSTGSTSLLGDACHPMLPFLAQGAAQAIGDAAALSEALLSSASDLPAGLRRYEAARRDHTAEVQRQSWTNNVIYHLADGEGQQQRDRQLATSSSFDTFGWIYGNDPFTVPV